MTIAILGGGITGLAAAWELQQRGIRYTLFERSERLGGKIQTERIDGFVIESGPDSFLSSKRWGWQLAHALGLADRMVGTRESARNVYVLKNGTLHPFPKGMRLIVPVDSAGIEASELMSAAGKARMLAEVDIQPYTPPDDESLAEFVIRHFGVEALDLFGEPLLAGIYVGDPREMSLRATNPLYHELAASHGSLIRGLRELPPSPTLPGAPTTPFFTFKNGTAELVEALADRLTGEIRLNQPIMLGMNESAQWTINGRVFNRIISALPASTLFKVLTDTPIPIEPYMIDALQPFVGGESETVIVTIGCKLTDLARPLNGSGFIVPRAEPTPIQACTWSSSKFAGRAPDGCALIRMYLRPERIDGDPVEVARKALSEILGLNRAAEPILTRVQRWQNPQYKVGHLARVAELETVCLPGWAIAGSSFYGVGVPDCIHQAQVAVEKVCAVISAPLSPNPLSPT